MTALAILLMGFCALPFIAMLQGWCLCLLWGWFLTPIFYLPPPHLAQAIGLCIVVGFFKSSKKSKSGPGLEDFVYAFLSPLFGLGFGWIVHHFFL